MKKNNFKYVLLLVSMLIVPMSASAATVYVESSRNTISVGDTAIVAIKINADGAVLNTVDGEVAIKATKGNVSVQEFSLANSAFGLWPRTPSLSQEGHLITFVGGVPGGFSIEGATMFKVIVEAKKEGVVTISPQNLSVFSNDGKGTKLPVTMKDFNITVVAKKQGVPAQNDWASIVSQDITPPEKFIIVLGQDKNLFEGKKFAFFSAVDNQSGIDHYDVSENGGAVVKSGSTYVLQDQGDNVKLNVVAYDKAGNKQIGSYEGAPNKINTIWIVVAIVVVILVVLRFYKKSKRNKLNASSGTL
jgi:uncharacterized protein YpmB